MANTDNLELAAQRVLRVAEHLEGPFVVARLCEALGQAVLRSQSPWLNRQDAATYARCSVSEIDRAAAAGVFKRYVRGGTPMFKKTELDTAIESGTWGARG